MTTARSAFAAVQAADLARVFASSAVGTVACTSGGVTAYGFADRVTLDDQDARGFAVTAPVPVRLAVPAGTWGTLTARAAALTLDDGALAGSYEVRAHTVSDDGLEDVYTLHAVGT